MPDGDVTRALDGHALKPMVGAALSWLRQHQESVNALNVFPVPDGDTGTNMTLTMTSAWDEIAELDEEHVGRLMAQVAHGALMGARGNSGVILSQIWRGFAHGLDEQRTVTVKSLVTATQMAADTAYKGVVKPVEGTILTVIREVSEEAVAVAEETEDLGVAFERLVQRAKVAVARTPSLLPVLRQAGVVDSGGQGLFVILEGMLRHMKGLPVTDTVTQEADLSHLHLDAHPEEEGALQFDSAYPYDVQFVILGEGLDVPSVKTGIEAMGDCPLTVGDAEAIKVHVHVADPGVPISFGAKFGSIGDVVVEDMRAQYEVYAASRITQPAMGPGMQLPVSLIGESEPPAISVVVVTSGDGLSNVFRSLGATAVVEGGQTMNPSTAQILEAIEAAQSDQVIVLPNNKNILMAAEQAAKVSEKQVVVIPTRTIPQGICAMLAVDQTSSLEDNADAMNASSQEVISGEVTWATRTVQLNGVRVKEGDAIGLLEDDLVVATRSFGEAVRWLLAEANLDDRELVTLYYGEQVTAEESEVLAGRLAEAYPDLEFEVIEGGQPHYPYILSIE